MKLNQVNNIYLLGIGGIGMSALARYFHDRGVVVSGYDRTRTTITQDLEALGVSVHYEEDLRLIPKNLDLVIYTPAIPSENTEFQALRQSNIPLLKRAEVLGLISNTQKTLAVAGTHGKTTTTSILTHLLKVGGIDCTAFLGGIARNFEGNYVKGTSDWVVVEADEYDRSFLQLTPNFTAITSIDADHLDIYENHENMKNSFVDFANRASQKTFICADIDFPSTNNDKIVAKAYGINKGIYQAKNIRIEQGFFIFDYESPIENINDIKFTLPGQHNILNAAAAIMLAQQLGIQGDAIKEAMITFKGIWRRFEFVVRNDDFVFIDDYAHHPSELRAAIEAARTLYPKEKITGVFQPHLFTRTRDFADDFAKALENLDEIYLLDIYPAREKPIPNVTSKIIFNKMKNNKKYITTKENLSQSLKLNKPKILLFLGAGDIDKLVQPVKNLLTN